MRKQLDLLVETYTETQKYSFNIHTIGSDCEVIYTPVQKRVNVSLQTRVTSTDLINRLGDR